MTARQNLRLLAAHEQIGPRRVAEVVGLGERSDEAVRPFALGTWTFNRRDVAVPT